MDDPLEEILATFDQLAGLMKATPQKQWQYMVPRFFPNLAKQTNRPRRYAYMQMCYAFYGDKVEGGLTARSFLTQVFVPEQIAGMFYADEPWDGTGINPIPSIDKTFDMNGYLSVEDVLESFRSYW